MITPNSRLYLSCLVKMKEISRIAILCNFPVWLVNDNIPAAAGHYAVWLPPLAEAFAEYKNFEIHWITISKAIKKPSRFVYKHQHFHVLPCISRQLGLYTLYLQDRINIYREIKKIAPALVHSWGTESVYGLCGKDYSHRCAWVHSVQGLLKSYMERGPMPRFFRHHSIYEPGVLRSCKHITAESPWAAERVRDIAPLAQPRIFEYAVEDRFYTQKRNLEDVPTCLYCGTNTPIKNLQCIISAFSNPVLSHVKLELAGVEPDSIPDLPPNIVPLGRISRDQVVEKLSKAWCLVHPSKADTGPTAAKEARVMGVPVILTTECGSKQYVEPGKSGYIFSPDDVESLIAGVLDITSSKERCLQMGAYSQLKCRECLSVQRMIATLDKIYRETLSL